MGLLLLRVAVGGTAFALGFLYFYQMLERTAAIWGIALLLILSGTALLIGLMTPFASLLSGFCVLGIALSWFPTPPMTPLTARLAWLVIVVIAVSIALLGPGAYSIDGCLFGRREIVIPPRPPEP